MLIQKREPPDEERDSRDMRIAVVSGRDLYLPSYHLDTEKGVFGAQGKVWIL